MWWYESGPLGVMPLGNEDQIKNFHKMSRNNMNTLFVTFFFLGVHKDTRRAQPEPFDHQGRVSWQGLGAEGHQQPGSTFTAVPTCPDAEQELHTALEWPGTQRNRPPACQFWPVSTKTYRKTSVAFVVFYLWKHVVFIVLPVTRILGRPYLSDHFTVKLPDFLID